MLGVTTKTVMRWEQGLTMPRPYYCEQLGTLFDKTAQELGLSYDADESKAINVNKLVNISEGPSAPPYNNVRPIICN